MTPMEPKYQDLQSQELRQTPPMSLIEASSFCAGVDTIEPIPISVSRSSSAVIQQALEDTIRILFEDGAEDHTPPPVVPSAENITKKRTQDQLFAHWELDHCEDEEDDSSLKPKRQRSSKHASEELTLLFRPSQADQWDQMFESLVAYKEEKGHCYVPHEYALNPSLARWVKRQRYQCKPKKEGKTSTMTQRRLTALRNIGFVRHVHSQAWEAKHAELKLYLMQHGDCNVPTNYKQNKQLATWVKCQRRQYKLFCDGKISTNMNEDRIVKLNKMGFKWEMRRAAKASSTW